MRGKQLSSLNKSLGFPGPCDYDPKSFKKRITFGYSFGNSQLGNLQDKKTPGPGNYETTNINVIFKKSPSPIMGSELRKSLNEKLFLKNPGPGTYTISTDFTLEKVQRTKYLLFTMIDLENRQEI